MKLSEVSTSEAQPRPDWRDSVALAADLALLGIVVGLASVPVVTAGGAVATGSVAADHVCTHRSLPPFAVLGRTFLRALLPGAGAVVVFVGVALVLALDLRAVAAGVVPGGPPLFVVTAVVAAAALALVLLTVVRVGATDGHGWLAALRWAAVRLRERPLVGLALLAVTVVPVVLAAAIPVLAVLLPGFLLFALHVVVRRLA